MSGPSNWMKSILFFSSDISKNQSLIANRNNYDQSSKPHHTKHKLQKLFIWKKIFKQPALHWKSTNFGRVQGKFHITSWNYFLHWQLQTISRLKHWSLKSWKLQLPKSLVNREPKRFFYFQLYKITSLQNWPKQEPKMFSKRMKNY